MFFRTRKPRRPTLPDSVREEVHSICRAQQLDKLSLSQHLLRDVGMDCGCIGPERIR